MLKVILSILLVFIIICVFWFPKNTVGAVHNFWQSHFVRSSIIYAETNGVPITKILPKEEQKTQLFHR